MYGTCDVFRLAQISLFVAVSMSDHRHRAVISVLHKMLSLNSTRCLTTVQSSFTYRAQLRTSHYFSLRMNTDPVLETSVLFTFYEFKAQDDGHSTYS